MKNYTGQFTKYENTEHSNRIWLKNVIPNSLGYCPRYIDVPHDLNRARESIEHLLADTWLEFNGVERVGLESDNWSHDNNPEIRFNTYVKILK